MKKIQTLEQARKYLYTFVPKEKEYKFPGDFGLKRTKHFLKLLGNPQNTPKVIHIAGTSGKGSTAFYTSTLLRCHGLKVGLHVSPHLIDIRERFQINNNLLSEGVFVKYLNEIISKIEELSTSAYGNPTYFEISVVLAFHIFSKEKVNYAVVETGLGGLLDGTNVVDAKAKVAVITRIGHDHTDILGKTLDKIAAQKAGIIQNNNPVITLSQHRFAQKVIEKTAKLKKTAVMVIKKSRNYKNIAIKDHKVSYDFTFLDFQLKDVELNSAALFQVENSSLALAVVLFLSKRDYFKINPARVLKALGSAVVMGRMDMLKINKKIVVLDGAHNPQKMSVFIASLEKEFPGKAFQFLIAVKKGKDYREMLNYILPVAKNITVTTFFNKKQGFIVASQEPKIIMQHLYKKNFLDYSENKKPITAFQNLVKSAKDPIVVTGSLYLLSEIYSYLRKSKVILSR